MSARTGPPTDSDSLYHTVPLMGPQSAGSFVSTVAVAASTESENGSEPIAVAPAKLSFGEGRISPTDSVTAPVDLTLAPVWM